MIPTGQAFALSGSLEELRAIAARLSKVVADADEAMAHPELVAAVRGRIDPNHTVGVALPEVEALELAGG